MILRLSYNAKPIFAAFFVFFDGPGWGMFCEDKGYNVKNVRQKIAGIK